MPRDCLEVRDMGFNTSGVYHITPIGVYRGFDVYCDMETDDGGWLVSSLTQLVGTLQFRIRYKPRHEITNNVVF